MGIRTKTRWDNGKRMGNNPNDTKLALSKCRFPVTRVHLILIVFGALVWGVVSSTPPVRSVRWGVVHSIPPVRSWRVMTISNDSLVIRRDNASVGRIDRIDNISSLKCDKSWKASKRPYSGPPENQELFPLVWPLGRNKSYTLKDYNRWNWQSLGKYQFLSAHYDDRDNSVVLLVHNIGAGFPDFPGVTLFLHGNDTGLCVSPQLRKVDGLEDRRHLSVGKFYCPAVNSPGPSHVVISMNTTDEYIVLPVRYPLKEGPNINFGLCVAPLQYPHRLKPATLATFVELYRLLGVEKFVIFKYHVSNEVQKLLTSYAEKGLADVIPWPLYNENTTLEVHYKGQSTAYAVCLYRYLIKMKHLVIADLDEFIIPSRPGNKTLHRLVTLGGPRTGLWGILNNWFPIQLNSSNKFTNDTRVAQLGITPLLKTRRSLKKFKFGFRSKYIVKLRRANLLLTHYAELTQGHSYFIVQPSDARLHHYRLVNVAKKNWENQTVEDWSVFKYASELIKSVDLALNRTNGGRH